jgi:hypothetical protein
MDGPVNAIALSGSDVYAGGTFFSAGGSPAMFIAKWNGTAWSALGSGLNNTVYSLAVSGPDIYAGGVFTTAGGSPANRIAKWNGTTWSALGTGMNSIVFALAVSGTDVHAGGNFTTAGGSPANYIAKWNGTTWSDLATGTNSTVNAVGLSGADVYAGGTFTIAGCRVSGYFGRYSYPGATSVQFAATGYIDDESQSAVITVTRTGDLSGTSSVDVVLTGGTATGGASCATPGVDYVYTGPVTLNFAISDNSESFSVPLCGDLVNEGTETVNLSLTSNVNADIGTPSTAVLNINDTASQFRNTTAIDMFSGTQGIPNPSTINVTSGPLVIGSMRVTLYDLSQSFPDNVDVLLVGPNGAKYVLMADTGGPFAVSDTNPVTLSFTDTASAVLPDSAALSTGTYLPTNCETPVLSFAPPAPAAPYIEPGCVVSRPVTQTMFGAFGLTSPLGNWHLYVRDDNGSPIMASSTGAFSGGWGIEFLPPTAAGVEVSGRVMTPDGRGLRNATVTMTDGQGVTRSAVTSSFGYYRFEGVPVGDSFVMTVNSRLFRFKPRIVNVVDNLSDVDFVGLE